MTISNGQADSPATSDRIVDPRKLYTLLSAPFDPVFHDVRGSRQIEYLTGEQVISRLNRLLGFETWSFRVLEHGVEPEADEVWVLGELRVVGFGGEPVVRQQFGSQRIMRSRDRGSPLELGDDLKAAATDCLKKCATLIGVGLYLSRKDGAQRARSTEHGGAATATNDSASGASLVCVECGAALKSVKFRDGTTWTPADLAGHGREKFGRVLCVTHNRQAAKQTASAAATDTATPRPA
jgi:hypothetical protein